MTASLLTILNHQNIRRFITQRSRRDVIKQIKYHQFLGALNTKSIILDSA
jgi:hypothetical protein